MARADGRAGEVVLREQIRKMTNGNDTQNKKQPAWQRLALAGTLIAGGLLGGGHVSASPKVSTAYRIEMDEPLFKIPPERRIFRAPTEKRDALEYLNVDIQDKSQREIINSYKRTGKYSMPDDEELKAYALHLKELIESAQKEAQAEGKPLTILLGMNHMDRGSLVTAFMTMELLNRLTPDKKLDIGLEWDKERYDAFNGNLGPRSYNEEILLALANFTPQLLDDALSKSEKEEIYALQKRVRSGDSDAKKELSSKLAEVEPKRIDKMASNIKAKDTDFILLGGAHLSDVRKKLEPSHHVLALNSFAAHKNADEILEEWSAATTDLWDDRKITHVPLNEIIPNQQDVIIWLLNHGMSAVQAAMGQEKEKQR